MPHVHSSQYINILEIGSMHLEASVLHTTEKQPPQVRLWYFRVGHDPKQYYKCIN